MSPEARILFEQFLAGVDTWTRATGSAVRAFVDTSALMPQQQQKLQLAIRDELQELIWHTLGRFDNVGCSLPDGVRGFRILAKPYDSRDENRASLPEVDIRRGETDYADMWLEFLMERNRSSVPSLPQFLRPTSPASGNLDAE